MLQIESALLSLFNRHRIVFWYDAKKEFRQTFNEVCFPGIEKLEIANNQFGIKYQLLREKPGQKFLLYHEGPQPNDVNNWLLDIQLAETVFNADQTSLWLTELRLDPSFLSLIATHHKFFENELYRSLLKSSLTNSDTKPVILQKMLAILAQCDSDLDEIFFRLLAELAQNKQSLYELISSCGLEDFLWKEALRKYGYKSEVKSLEDLALKLFEEGFLVGLGEKPKMTNDAYILLRRWKDNVNTQQDFEKLSEKYAELLNIDEKIKGRDLKIFLDTDIFRKYDGKIIRELARELAQKTILPAACREIINRRKTSHWFSKYEQFYAVLENTALFLESLKNSQISIINFQDGVRKYSSTWYKVDQYYRKVMFHARKAGVHPVIEELVTLVENLYSNQFLTSVNNLWQEQVNRIDIWDSSPIPLQSLFYERYVKPFLDDGKKVYVVISDALRYEIGEELASSINHEDRYDASIEANCAMLPSYTQLGMAALLPHQNLSLAGDSSGMVFVDQQNSSGTVNRERILQKYRTDATAIQAEDFLYLSAEDTRSFVKENSVVYIYHNRIDATGDKKDTEERVFEAAEETIKELVQIIKKLNAGNATNMIITADHGFIYQNSYVDESDFSTIQPKGDEIFFLNRRFVIGKGLAASDGLRKFTTQELGLIGEVEIQIPNTTSRLRLSGSGSRYVHGGATLQEVVIPVILVNKKRERNLANVEVNLIQNATKIITTSQFSVTLFQVDPINDKLQPRQIRLAVYDRENHCISDQQEILFDSISENSHDREHKIRILLTREADRVENQDVFLKLEEKIPNTEHYREYQKITYTIRRTFTPDFDF